MLNQFLHKARFGWLVFLSVWLGGTAQVLQAQVCATPGKDGGTVSAVSVSGVVNTYYPSVVGATAGTTLLGVGAPVPGSNPAVTAGDLLLVIQIQGASINSSNSMAFGDGIAGAPAVGYLAGTRDAGRHEFVVATGPVQAVGCPPGAGQCLPVLGTGGGGGLLNSYLHGNSPRRERFQVIRVPQYFSAVLTSSAAARPWDGATGGVLVLDIANTLDLNAATVDITGTGFRGGGGRSLSGGAGFSNADIVRPSTVLFHASKGEGVAGTPRFVFDGTAGLDLGVDAYPGGGFARGAPANAGGGGNDWVSSNGHNSGGGGGGNGGSAGRGGFSWSSAQDVGGFGGVGTPGTEIATLMLGGGGGAGTSNNAGPGHGGRGGGILHVRAARFINSGTWIADGNQPLDSRQDGAGGGGAGGSLSGATCSGQMGNLSLLARGGRGGDVDWNVGDFHGPGGGGGGGVVLTSNPIMSADVTGGGNGTSPTAAAFGALGGSVGDVASSLPVAGPGASPGCVCRVTAALVTSVWLEVGGPKPRVIVETASTVGTASLDLLRETTSGWEPVSAEPALVSPGTSGNERFVFEDIGALIDQRNRYLVVEKELTGREQVYGPFDVEPVRAQNSDLRIPDPRWPLARYQPSSAKSVGSIGESNLGQDAAESLRIEVDHGGWFQIPLLSIADGFGVDLELGRSWVKTKSLRLTTRNRKVAWLADPQGDGIIFYGQGPDDLKEHLAVTSPVNVFRLRRGPGLVMAKRSGTPRTIQTAPPWFVDTWAFEEQRFAATVASTNPEVDYWFWTGMAADTSHDEQTLLFELPGLAEGVAPSSLTVHLVGANTVGRALEHEVEVVLNGQELGVMRWAGQRAFAATFVLDQGQINTSNNELRLRALLPDETEQSFVYVDRFEVSSARQLRLPSESSDLPIFVADSDEVIEVEGVSNPLTMIFDLKSERRPVLLEGGTFHSEGEALVLSFQATRKGRHDIVSPASLSIPRVSSWLQAEPALANRHREGELIVIAPESLRSVAETWAESRRRAGLLSVVVSRQEINNELMGGLSSPRALKRFLRKAQGWEIPPRFVLLLGQGHFDYQGYSGVGDNKLPPALVPTPSGLFASDRWFLPKSGPVPAIGRLPIHTAEEAMAVLRKLESFETREPSLEVVLVGDDADTGGNFSLSLSRFSRALGPSWHASVLSLDDLPISELRPEFFGALESEPDWVHYFGHGGLDRLAAEGILASDDLEQLPELLMGTIFSALSCNVGRFEVPGVASLAGDLLQLDNRGFVAVLAPTGVGFHSQSDIYGLELARQLGHSSGRRLGDVLQATSKQFLARGGDVSVLNLLHLFGDPSLELP